MLYLQRGVLLAMKAQLSQAEKAFEKARSLAPDRPAPYAALAMIWMQTGQTEKAVERLREEARVRTKDHVIPYTFAVALVRSGIDPSGPAGLEAVEALRASIRANAAFAPARSQLGRLLLRRDDLDGAVRELEKAIELDPGATAALYNLGQAYNRKGDRQRASELLARVSKLNAQERGDDPDGELKRTVVRIVRDGAAPAPGPAP
jgi:tetratricopeptide (TPR) repeat protein